VRVRGGIVVEGVREFRRDEEIGSWYLWLNSRLWFRRFGFSIGMGMGMGIECCGIDCDGIACDDGIGCRDIDCNGSVCRDIDVDDDIDCDGLETLDSIPPTLS
jgi:hypothetical protein